MTRGATKKLVFALAATVVTIVVATYTVAKLRSTEPQVEFGKVAKFNGRIQISNIGSGSWHGIADGDAIWTGTQIKSLMNASLNVAGRGREMIVGPDSVLSIKALNTGTAVVLQNGELQFNSSTDTAETLVETKYGIVTATGKGAFIVSHPAGANFTMVRAISGVVAAVKNKITYSAGPQSETLFLSDGDTNGIWSVSPVLNDAFVGKEGFAAIEFSWKSKEPIGAAHVLLRNLATGEISIHQAQGLSTELTLPVGQYSWNVNAGGMVTTTRMFQISGDPPSETLTETRDQNSTSADKENATTNTAEIQNLQDNGTSVGQEESEPAPQEVITTNNKKTETESASTLEAPKIIITSPSKGSKVALNEVTNQRIRWQTTGKADYIEFDLVASSGNPSMRFVLQGYRTRRRLPEIPPGRYTARVRATAKSKNEKRNSEWSEIYFDVIQTEPGQLAPKDVSVRLSTHKKRQFLVIEWSKSSAPQYQVTVHSKSLPSKILQSDKSKLIIPAPRSGKASVIVCALDANQQVRGCAPEVTAL